MLVTNEALQVIHNLKIYYTVKHTAQNKTVFCVRIPIHFLFGLIWDKEIFCSYALKCVSVLADAVGFYLIYFFGLLISVQDSVAWQCNLNKRRKWEKKTVEETSFVSYFHSTTKEPNKLPSTTRTGVEVEAEQQHQPKTI